MEIVGEKPHEVLNSIHFGSPGTDGRALITHVHPLPGGSTVADWHVYAVEWEPGEIRFYVDDVHTRTYDHWWSCSLTQGRPGRDCAPRGRPQPLAGALRPALLPGDERRRRRQLPRRAQPARRASRPNWWSTMCACTTRSAATARPGRSATAAFPGRRSARLSRRRQATRAHPCEPPKSKDTNPEA